jgi:acyl carrier protein
MEDPISQSNLNQHVRDVIVKTFKLSSEDSGCELRMGSVPGWDSLGHMNLVVELEREFGVSFPLYLLPEMLDMDSIVRETLKLKAEQ